VKSLSSPVSEDSEKQFASGEVRDSTEDDAHHCPATIVHLGHLHRGTQTLAVVLLVDHLGLFCPHVVLTKFVGGNHFFCKLLLLRKYICFLKVLSRFLDSLLSVPDTYIK